MKKIVMWILGASALLASMAVSAADESSAGKEKVRPAPIACDFEGGFKRLEVKSEKSKITGEMPPRCEDDSAWADVDVEYAKVLDNPFQGKGALRVTVKEIRNGAVLFRLPRVKMSKDWFAKVKFALRSPDSVPVKTGIRRVDSPYNYYGSREVTAIPEWVKHELLVSPVADDPYACLMFEVRTPSVLEVDEVSIEYLSPAEVAEGVRLEGNLLTNSSFPNWLPAPWTPFHESYSPENYASDPVETGPTGVASFRMTTAPYGKHGVAAITCPFVGLGDRHYTFSFWAKAENSGHFLNMRFGPPDEKLWVEPYQKTIALGKEWKRFSFTLKLPYSSSGFYLAQIMNWGPKGRFWVDGVQVEASENVTDFKRCGRVEAAVQPLEPYGLYEAGQPFRLKAAVYGEITDGMLLRSEICDVYGKAHPMPDLALKAGSFQSMDVELPEAGQPPLGSYRLEYRVVDKEGKEASKTGETLLHRVRPAKFAGQLRPDSPFGIHLVPNSEMPKVMRKLGFTWARQFGMDWQSVEKEKGQWSFEGMDGIVRNLRESGLCVLGIFAGIPEWARSWKMPEPPPKGYNNWHAKSVPPKDLGEWSEYCRRMAERYKDKVEAWETWNEPFLPGFLNAGFENGKYVHPAPEEFLRIHKAAADGARTGDPDAIILLNAGAHYHAPADAWTRKLFAEGAFKTVDAVSYHSYLASGIGYPGDAIYKATKENSNPEDPVMQVWNTEGGPGPSDVRNFYRRFPPLGKEDKSAFWADYMVRYWVSTLASGADKFFLYTNHGWGEFGNTYSPLNVDGRLSPNMAGISNLAWHLEGKRYVETCEVTQGLFAYLFEDGAGSAAVLIPKSAVSFELDIGGTEVKARDLFGNDLQAPVKLGGYAVFMEGKGMPAAKLASAIAGKGSGEKAPIQDTVPLEKKVEEKSFWIRLFGWL